MPELDSCASLERACRLWAAQHSRGKRPAHWAPSRCLGCSSQPPPKPPIALPLATQVDHRYHRHRRGRALGGRPDSAEVLRLPDKKEEESRQGGKGEGLQGGFGLELLGADCTLCTGSGPPVWCLGPRVAHRTCRVRELNFLRRSFPWMPPWVHTRTSPCVTPCLRTTALLFTLSVRP